MNTAVKLAMLSRIFLASGTWDETADAWARLIPHDSPGIHGDHLRAQVEAGEAKLDYIVTPAGRVGILVYTVMDYPVPEFVIIAMYARESGADLTAEVYPSVRDKARAMGCGTIRFHTMRPGLVRKACALGFRVSEVVMRADIRA